MPRSDSLSQERKRALLVLLDNLSNIPHLLLEAHRLNKDAPLVSSGCVVASYSPILAANLPKESKWTWNQSNAKQTVMINGLIVTMRKVSPRSRMNRSSTLVVPSFKIWLFDVQSQTFESLWHFLWCEKGIELPAHNPNGIDTAIGTVHPESISLQSLSFLAGFVDIASAIELGWF